MFASAKAATVIGIEAHPVEVEAYVGKGLPGWTMIGLARGAVKESVVRVRAALQASGVALGTHRLVVSLSPAEMPKEASGLDLALAMAIMAVCGQLPPEVLRGRRFWGELSIGGRLEPVRGAVLLSELARRAGDRELVVPVANAAEAAIIPGVTVVGAGGIAEVVQHLLGTTPIAAAQPSPPAREPLYECLSDVQGQRRAKRAIEVAAAGGHNVLLMGPPGSGKTMLARRLAGLLPELEPEASIEVTRIHSAAGLLGEQGLVRAVPFRAPHHTASEPALCGGGPAPRPGEITLAHRGVLFLDELPEFSRRALESLREPLESGEIHIARSAMSLRFPARVLLVAAMNPCPCGRYRGDFGEAELAEPTSATAMCLCSFEQVHRYRSRLSGPLLDRIDLHVLVDAVPFAECARGGDGESSQAVGARVAVARRRQMLRLGRPATNAEMSSRELREQVPFSSELLEVVEPAVAQHGLSRRAVDRVLRVARTIADLSDCGRVSASHVREALQLRLLDGWETGAPGEAPSGDLAAGLVGAARAQETA